MKSLSLAASRRACRPVAHTCCSMSSSLHCLDKHRWLPAPEWLCQQALLSPWSFKYVLSLLQCIAGAQSYLTYVAAEQSPWLCSHRVHGYFTVLFVAASKQNLQDSKSCNTWLTASLQVPAHLPIKPLHWPTRPLCVPTNPANCPSGNYVCPQILPTAHQAVMCAHESCQLPTNLALPI